MICPNPVELLETRIAPSTLNLSGSSLNTSVPAVSSEAVTEGLLSALSPEISPDGKSATFVDVDGDVFTVTTSKGTFSTANFTYLGDTATGQGYLQKIDIGFNTFFRTGWKRFYLKWYGDFLPSGAALCPRTTELLAGIPSVNAAMFTLLPPGSRLGAHRDPFAGSLRYHLGLVTPNSPECFIVVDGEKYYWKDGEAVMFDETYIHTAENRTDVTRVILFCDVERPLSNPIVRALNRTIGRSMIKAAATQNVPGEHVGVLNHVFEYVYKIRILGTRIKAWNRPVYYLLKWLLIAALLYAILV